MVACYGVGVVEGAARHGAALPVGDLYKDVSGVPGLEVQAEAVAFEDEGQGGETARLGGFERAEPATGPLRVGDPGAHGDAVPRVLVGVEVAGVGQGDPVAGERYQVEAAEDAAAVPCAGRSGGQHGVPGYLGPDDAVGAGEHAELRRVVGVVVEGREHQVVVTGAGVGGLAVGIPVV